MTIKPVVPAWIFELPLQQQTVLLLPLRGPDGLEKFAACKNVVRYYRGTVLLSARAGRVLREGELAGDFMVAFHPNDSRDWYGYVRAYFAEIDRIPHHYHSHLMHGAEILGYKHPDDFVRDRWRRFYERCADDKHLNPETLEQMDARLGDWGQKYWTE